MLDLANESVYDLTPPTGGLTAPVRSAAMACKN
jgi:hypothetical protein